MTKKHDPATCADCQEAMRQTREWIAGHAENVSWMCDELGMTPSEARLHIRTLELEHILIEALEWMMQSQLPKMLFTSASSSKGGWN